MTVRWSGNMSQERAAESLWSALEESDSGCFERRALRLVSEWALERDLQTCRWETPGRDMFLIDLPATTSTFERGARQGLLISVLLNGGQCADDAPETTASGRCVARGGLLLCHALTALEVLLPHQRERSLGVLIELRRSPNRDWLERLPQTRWSAAQGQARLDEVAGVLAETGGLTLSDDQAQICLVPAAQTGAAWFQLTASAQPHDPGLKLEPSALDKMGLAMQRMASADKPARTSAIIDHLLEAGARRFGAAWQQDTRKWMMEQALDATPSVRRRERYLWALVHDQWTVTRLRADGALDQCGPSVSATLDCRLVPGSTVSATETALRACVGPLVSLELLGAREAKDGDLSHPLWSVLVSVLQGVFPQALVAPTLQLLNHDAWGWRQRAVACFGFCPVGLSPKVDGFAGWHRGQVYCDLDGRSFGRALFVNAVSRFIEAR